MIEFETYAVKPMTDRNGTQIQLAVAEYPVLTGFNLGFPAITTGCQQKAVAAF